MVWRDYRRLTIFRTALWIGFIVIMTFLLITNSSLLIGAVTGDTANRFEQSASIPNQERDTLAEERNGTTVFSSHLGEGQLTAINRQGRLQYYNDTYDGYWDIDPISGEKDIILYSATKVVDCQFQNCLRQVIETVNLTSGDTHRLYTRLYRNSEGNQWHDVDRIGPRTLLVADMAESRVFKLNTSTEKIIWQWDAQSIYSTTNGGDFPRDWTHLNDVEEVRNGTIMVSIRNFDEVVFIRPNGTLAKDWTLGESGSHDILYEQHNPDYIPKSRGGPAVVVADSENNRIVEYQRTANGSWSRSWSWRDAQLSWARDADRLPSGNTLISDSHGGRVFEVAPNDSIVWSLSVPSVYESERLSTRDESGGGPSANSADLRSQTTSLNESLSIRQRIGDGLKSVFPAKIVHGVNTVTPDRILFAETVVFALGILIGLALLIVELYARDYGVRNPISKDI
ncbi:arylsulfotransferase family protein [Halococcus sp. AFM35]|uniref:arylsulfotransferase family protein n=1 Tax=Halococcus sp. AFM35 TaxID=3421653 RepID=UPI003EB9BA9F